jgi:hypothetical protein
LAATAVRWRTTLVHGDRIAMLEATLALATIVRQVDIRSLEGVFATEVPFTAVDAGAIRAQ